MFRIVAAGIALSATVLATILLSAAAEPEITYEQLSANGGDKGYYAHVNTYRYSTGTSYAFMYLTGPSIYYYCYGYNVENAIDVNNSVKKGSASFNTGNLNYYNYYCSPHVDVEVDCSSNGQHQEKFIGDRIVQTPAGTFSTREQRKLSHASCAVAIGSLGIALNGVPGVMQTTKR